MLLVSRWKQGYRKCPFPVYMRLLSLCVCLLLYCIKANAPTGRSPDLTVYCLCFEWMFSSVTRYY